MVRDKIDLEKYCNKAWYDIFRKREELFKYAVERLNEVVEKVNEIFKTDLDKIADDYNVVILFGLDKYRNSIFNIRPTFWILARINNDKKGRKAIKRLEREVKGLIGEAWDSGNFRIIRVEDLPIGYKYHYGSKAEEVIRKIKELRGELNNGGE